jgi:aubergine-like protein
VAGFCATMNDSYTKYCSSVQFQRGGQEIIDGLKLCMGEALRQYFRLNNQLPSLIIVYRDGVGDGMLDAVV